MDKPKLSAYRWVILAVVCLVCILANYMQYQVSALAVYLMPMFGIDEAGFSMLLLMPMLTAVFLSIPMGTLGDKLGPKRVVAACMLVAVLGGFLRTFGDSFVLQMISMFMLGAGISALNANLVKIFSVWFMEKTQIAMGFFFGSAGVGVILAQMVAPMFGSVFMSYLTAAIALTVVAVLWIILLKDAPAGVPPMRGGESPVKYFKVAAKSRNVWLIALSYGFSLAACTAFAGFIPQALILSCGVDAVTAGMIASCAALGSIIGSLVGPMICDRLGKWKPYLIITIVIGTLLMVYFWYGVIMSGSIPSLPVLMTVMVASGAFGAINGPIVQAMPYALPDIRGKYAGSAGGLISTIGLLCSYFIPVAVSAAAVGSYVLNLGIESAIFLASGIFILLIPELGPKGAVARKIAEQEQAVSAAGPAAGSEGDTGAGDASTAQA